MALLTKLRLSQIYQSILEKENKKEKKVPTGYIQITLIANDSEGVIYKILEHMKYNGDIGHSYSIIMDPDRSEKEGKLTTGWDGDGSDKIYKLDIKQVSEEEARKSK